MMSEGFEITGDAVPADTVFEVQENNSSPPLIEEEEDSDNEEKQKEVV